MNHPDNTNMLLGALDRGRLIDPRSTERLTELDAAGGPPPLGPATRITSMFHPYTPPRSEPEGPLEQATAALQAQLSDARTSQKPADYATAAAGLRHLIERLDATDSPPDHRAAALTTAADVAKTLATAPLGSDDPDLATAAGALLRLATEPGDVPNQARAAAAEGLHLLITRPDGAGDRFTDAARQVLTELLDHPADWVRASAADSISALYPDPAARQQLLVCRLEKDPNSTATAALLAQTGNLARTNSVEADLVLQAIFGHTAWQLLFTSPETEPAFDQETQRRVDSIADLLTFVAVVGVGQASAKILKIWLTNPLEYPYRAERATVYLRDYLNASGDPGPVARAQEVAFTILATALDPSIELWNQVADTTGQYAPNPALKKALRVPASIAHQIYFASGASGHANDQVKTGPRRRQFSKHAFPVLERLAELGMPALTLDIVTTLTYLADADPAQAAHIAATATDHSIGFESEHRGEQAVLALLDRYVGDFRDTLINDPSVTGAIRRIIDHFVAAGWDRVIPRAQTLSDIYR